MIDNVCEACQDACVCVLTTCDACISNAAFTANGCQCSSGYTLLDSECVGVCDDPLCKFCATGSCSE